MRQVLVATHSPYFVQLQRKDELVHAKNTSRYTNVGVIEPLVCRPCRDSWRCTNEDYGVAHIALQSYLLPPEERRMAIEDDL